MLGFFDAFGYLTSYDDGSHVEIILEPSPSIILDFKSFTKGGKANFFKFLFKGEKGKAYKVKINKLGNDNFFKERESEIEFVVRDCLVGEVDLAKDQLCDICPLDVYSVLLNASK